MQKPMFSSTIYFSYNQFMVYSADVYTTEVGFDWTDAHVDQGFARRESSVSFDTLVQFGNAEVSVYLGPFANPMGYDRAIAVPFFTKSGEVGICGPDEMGIGRQIVIRSGHYRLTEAQKVVQRAPDLSERESISIDLYFEILEHPLPKSQIIIRDMRLSPPDPLLESAEVAD